MARSKLEISVAEAIFGGPGVTIENGTVMFDREVFAAELQDDEASGRLKACGIARMGFDVKYEDYADGMFDA